MSRSVLLVLVMLMTGACFQAVNAGSTLQPVTEGPDGGSDGGTDGGSDGGIQTGSDAGFNRAVFWATDGSVPCVAECAAETGGQPQCAGEFVIRSQQEWQTFQQLGCSYISGSLELAQTDTTTLTVTGLQRVSGRLRISGSLINVSFPDLAVLGFNLDLWSTQLSAVSFPSLTTSGSVNANVAPALTTLAFPVLQEVRGHLTIDNSALTTLSLPALTKVHGAYLAIGGGSTLQSISAPLLQGVVGNLLIGGPALTTLNMPSLSSAGNLYIGSTGLTSLGLSSFTAVLDGQLSVSANPQLRQCLVDALRDQLTPAPIQYSASGNDGIPNTCP